MKKLTALLLALLLCTTLALPAAAETQTLTVEFESAQNPTYTLTIPNNMSIESDKNNNIGMVSISGSELWGYHVDVSCTISPFVGEVRGVSSMGFLAYTIANGDMLGDCNSENGQSIDFTFWDVNEDGTIADIAKDAEWNQVDSLYAATYLDGVKAPSDTYKATVTFTSELVLNAT